MNDANAPEWVRLESSTLVAEVDRLGAQLMTLRTRDGTDLLWNGDPPWWNGRAPVLFPIVGALRDGHYRWRGGRFALPRHGFARVRRFSLERRDATSASFLLLDDEQTRCVYPFGFELEVSFLLADDALTVAATVRNVDTQALPASLGFHPALRWPLRPGAGRAGHYIEFGSSEPAEIRRLDANGLLRPERFASPAHGRRLDLRDDLFRDDVVIFDALRSRSLTYGDGHDRVSMAFPDATHLGLWTKPGAPFICIEPWQGVADPVGFAGDLDAKPGMFDLRPGTQQRLTMTLRPA